MQKKIVFVDGAGGTVGMALQPYLQAMCAEGLIEVLSLPEDSRKAPAAREGAMSQADIVVFCLPDTESSEAAARLGKVNPAARILDASAFHRCDAEWTYGLPELISKESIAKSSRVANPGCFATACILAGFPLVRGFQMERIAYQGMTGFSAGGRKAGPNGKPQLVQFGRAHRHLPEIEKFTGAIPVLTTAVGPWRQGMLVQTFVTQEFKDVLEAYQACFDGHPAVKVFSAEALNFRVDPQACNGTNDSHIVIAAQPNGGTSIAVVLDNLGKGSAGAAADNLRLMLA